MEYLYLATAFTFLAVGLAKCRSSLAPNDLTSLKFNCTCRNENPLYMNTEHKLIYQELLCPRKGQAGHEKGMNKNLTRIIVVLDWYNYMYRTYLFEVKAYQATYILSFNKLLFDIFR